METNDFSPLDHHQNRNLSGLVSQIRDSARAETPLTAKRDPMPSVPLKNQPKMQIKPGVAIGAALLMVIALSFQWQLTQIKAQISGIENSVAPLIANNPLNQPETQVSKEEKILSRLSSIEANVTAMQQRLSKQSQEVAELQQQQSQQAKENASKLANISNPQGEEAKLAQQKSTAQPGKNWFINIAALSRKESAESLRNKIRQLGREAIMDTVQVKGKQLYRLRVNGLGSQSEAEKEALILQKELNMNSFWVAKD